MLINKSRTIESESLRQWLLKDAGNQNLSIFGISGYGGVGKSFLLKSVLDELQLHSKGWLEIRVDGSNRAATGDFAVLLDTKFAPQRLGVGKASEDFFPQIRRLIAEHRHVAEEFQAKLGSSSVDEKTKAVANLLFKTGRWLNKAYPKSKLLIDLEKQKVEDVNTILEVLIAIVNGIGSILPGPLKDLLGITFRERVRTDLYNLAAELYISDLEAMLAGYRKQDRLKFLKTQLKGYDKLLFIVDDYEIIGKTIGDFFVSSLIPELAKAQFPVKVLILGRDDIYDADIGLQQHFAHYVEGKLRLEQFSDEIALGMFREAGYGEAECNDLLKKSKGFPFLVSLFCEAKGGTVTFYQQFWDRTTRWMTSDERDWVIPLAYLDRVDTSTIAKMLPDADPRDVMGWFKNEASLREPDATQFVMASFIREMFKHYHGLGVGRNDVELMLKRAELAACE
ncbi:MAG: hypothetical protein U1A72_01615 [Sulfuritalea sp.]|nr:hypothetical protein [Sulfuritalea sp.]